jgi:hypothetical protein
VHSRELGWSSDFCRRNFDRLGVEVGWGRQVLLRTGPVDQHFLRIGEAIDTASAKRLVEIGLAEIAGLISRRLAWAMRDQVRMKRVSACEKYMGLISATAARPR